MDQKTPDIKKLTLNLSQRMMGAAFLAGGYIFRYMGLIPTIIMLAFSLLMNIFLHWSLIEVLDKTQSKTYVDLVTKLINKKFAYFIDLTNVCLTVGTLTSYQIVSCKAVEGLLVQYTAVVFPVKFVVRPIISIVFLIPLSLIKDTEQLAVISPFSILAVIITMISVVWYFVRSFFHDQSICTYYLKSQTIPLKNDYMLFPDRSVFEQIIGFCKYVPTMLFMLSTSALPFIQYGYKQQLAFGKFRGCFITAITFNTVLFALMSFAASFGFGQYNTGDILNTFVPCKYLMMDIIQIVYAVVLILTYPLVLQAAREPLIHIFKLDKTKNYKQYVAIGIMFIIVSTGVSCMFENLVQIFGLFSAFFGYFLYFLIPLLCYYQKDTILDTKKQNVTRDTKFKACIAKNQQDLNLQQEETLVKDEKNNTQQQKQRINKKKLTVTVLMNLFSLAICMIAFSLNVADFFKK